MLCVYMKTKLTITASNGERIVIVNREKRAVKVGIEAPKSVDISRAEAKRGKAA